MYIAKIEITVACRDDRKLNLKAERVQRRYAEILLDALYDEQLECGLLKVSDCKHIDYPDYSRKLKGKALVEAHNVWCEKADAEMEQLMPEEDDEQ